MRPEAYKCGIKPHEFQDMTLSEVFEYIKAFREQEQQEFKKRAILLDGLSLQLMSGLNMAKPKYLPLSKIHPEYFGTQKQNIPPERKEKAIANTWKTFLGA